VINPGNFIMFLWLSGIAPYFQEWSANGMMFELKTESSDYTNNVSMGSVFTATDYNVLSPAPVSKAQLENMQYSKSCKPSCSLIMPIECEPKRNVATHLYVAPNLDYNGGDPQFYNLGQVFLGSQGLANAETSPGSGVPTIGNIAEIWVTYEIVFYKPKIPTQEDTPQNELEQAAFYASTGISNATPLGDVMLRYTNSNRLIKVDPTVGVQKLTLPVSPGNIYRIELFYNALTLSTTAATQGPTFTIVNCSIAEGFYPNGSTNPLEWFFRTDIAAISSASSATLDGLYYVVNVKVDEDVGPDDLPTISFSNMTLPTTHTGINLTLVVTGIPLRLPLVA